MIDSAMMLPVLFAGLMALAFFVYAVLDGFDLGVGLMMPFVRPEQRDVMLASIGPFWDANETWLVLGVGLLLVAFPYAQGTILGNLYLPVTVLLLGLILRGVAFDFRAKVPTGRKATWDRVFFTGSLMATTAQGFMIGEYILGFSLNPWAIGFSLLSAVCVTSAYAFIGGGWLIMKTSGDLQQRAVRWSRRTVRLTMLGIAAVSLVNPVVSDVVFARWFSLPEAIILAPIPVLCAVALIGTDYYLGNFDRVDGRAAWLPFGAAVLVFFLSFQGLAYSFYPDIVPGQMDIWEAAAAEESLAFMAWGVVLVMPAILAYTVFSYRVFWGKAGDLTYH